mgnify:CR=1 FL=1
MRLHISGLRTAELEQERLLLELGRRHDELMQFQPYRIAQSAFPGGKYPGTSRTVERTANAGGIVPDM